jgi:hypothetical protein
MSLSPAVLSTNFGNVNNPSLKQARPQQSEHLFFVGLFMSELDSQLMMNIS